MTNSQCSRLRGFRLFLCVVGGGFLLPAAWAADASTVQGAGSVSAVTGPFATGANIEISRVDMDAEVQRVPAQVRPVTVVDPASLEIMVKNLYLRRALTQDAEAAGLAQERRALRLLVGEAKLDFPEAGAAVLDFRLPAGAYATTVLRELLEAAQDG